LEKKRQSLKKEGKVRYTMPVAADEPTYCYCGDVSYGEMIACENEVCLYIWGALLMIVLSSRVVSFGLCGAGCCSEGEVVLS
jgi:hypothetical protein